MKPVYTECILGSRIKSPQRSKPNIWACITVGKSLDISKRGKMAHRGGLDRKSVVRAQPNMVDHRQGSGRDHLNMVDGRLESGSTVSLKTSARFKFWKNKVSVNKLLKTTKIVIEMEGRNYNNKKLRSCIFHLQSPGDGGRLLR